jgi:2,4-dienoyl-CoA reductase (NADPH2)
MGTCLDDRGHVSDDTIAYYRRRAEGGIGTIIVEGCLVSADTVGPEPRITGREYLPGLARLVDELKRHEIAIGVQLMHPGRQVVAGPSVAPSPVPIHSAAPTPHQLDAAEIARIVEDYARAAALASEAGFDFVEVHGAHGYLPSNFLSPRDNQRTDAYGGCLEDRASFSLEVAAAIVSAVGPEMPLVWRINGDDGLPGGFTIEQAVEVSRWLQDAGAAAISVSGGTWHALHLTLAPMFVPRGHMVEYAGAVKRAVDVPVLAVGRLDDPTVAAQALASGHADLIMLGRALIADPDWPRHVAQTGFVRPCIACNACVDLVGRGLRARCSVNPEVGREAQWELTPAEHPRRVMVVGSGPAGMEAAEIASLRGHSVSIWERSPRLGGKLEVAGLAPSKREVLRIRDYRTRRLAELGVEIHVDVDVTPQTVALEQPDVVLLANGAEPLVPPIPGLDRAHVYDAQRVLRNQVPVAPGTRVVVIGGSATGCETAEFLLGAGASVAVLEMHGDVGHGIEPITRRHLVRTLRRGGVQLLTGAAVTHVGDVDVTYETDTGQHSIPADVVALAIGFRPAGATLAEQIVGPEVVIVGDAGRPADFVHAVNTGADAALRV